MPSNDSASIEVERVQTGVRLEKRLVKVLKGLAEQKDMTLSELLEGILLHALEGKQPFSRQTLDLIVQLRGIYGLELDASASHRLKDRKGA
jgi:hypothetical protein